MTTIHEPRLMQEEAALARSAGKRVAVVPTMGSLHDGHLALVREARLRADVVVVTLFVNPTQFGRGEDYLRYPRDPIADADLASGAGADILFAPSEEGMYGPGFQTYVTVEQVTLPLEGAARPGHFRGVATVVAKLFNITMPHVAVFGQKDAQQVAVIRRMIRDLDYDIELVVVPTVREPDGLAMSSRNAYLTAAQRKEAVVLYSSLQEAARMIRGGERSAGAVVAAMRAMITHRSSGAIDYITVSDGETLQELAALRPGDAVLVSLGVNFGTTRLIDNIQLTV